MMTGKTHNTGKSIILYKLPLALFPMLIVLILPSLAYATDMSGVILIPIVLEVAIVLAVLIALFGKFVLSKLTSLRDAKLSIKSFFHAMIVELIVISVFTYVFLFYATKYYDMRVVNFLSYLSTDVAWWYLQKSLVENRHVLSLIGMSFVFVAILSFINVLPNYGLLAKHTKIRLSRDKHWLYAYLLGTIAPAMFAMFFLIMKTSLFAIQPSVARDITLDHKKAADIKNDLLRQAAAAGYPRVVETIIMKGTDVNAASKHDRKTALHDAVKIPDNFDTVELLLRRGADVNSMSSANETPLMIACSYVRAGSDVVQLLLDYGADVNARSFYGETALRIVSSRTRGVWVEEKDVKGANIAKKLLDHGADANIKNKRGRTALMEASQASNLELIKLLLDHGADVNIEDNDGKTAYMLAKELNIKQILLNHGANTVSDKRSSFGRAKGAF